LRQAQEAATTERQAAQSLLTQVKEAHTKELQELKDQLHTSQVQLWRQKEPDHSTTALTQALQVQLE